jgi:hypothetical protein
MDLRIPEHRGWIGKAGESIWLIVAGRLQAMLSQQLQTEPSRLSQTLREHSQSSWDFPNCKGKHPTKVGVLPGRKKYIYQVSTISRRHMTGMTTIDLGIGGRTSLASFHRSLLVVGRMAMTSMPEPSKPLIPPVH